jgi:RNA polymerase sigma-32 factor
MANTSTDAVNTNKKDGSAPTKNDARDAALKAAAQRPP